MTRFKTIILALAVLAVFLFIAFVTFGVWFTKTQIEMYGVGGGISLSTEPVEIMMGDKGYLIPRNYIQAHNADGFKSGFTITVLLPDMEPITKANRAKFEQGVDDKYHVSLNRSVTAETAFNTRKHMNGPTIEKGIKYGMAHFVPAVANPRNSLMKDLFLLTDENGKFREGIVCTPEGTIGAAGDKPLNAICRDFYHADAASDYQIMYSRTNLPDWHTNRVKFEALMERFHQEYLTKKNHFN